MKNSMSQKDADRIGSGDVFTQRRAALAGIGGLAAGALLTRAASAGDLNPAPGPPGPTMKPLDIVEPRTPVGPDTTPGASDCVYEISQPGSYYLTGDVAGEPSKHGVKITASDVTLDLMGFALVGGAQSLDGVHGVSGGERVRVRNGRISDWGSDGVHLAQRSAHVESVHAVSNGWGGVRVGDDSSVEGCTAEDCFIAGVSAGSSSFVRGCVAVGTSINGVSVGDGSAVEGCIARNNNLAGFSAGDGATLSGCCARQNGRHGFTIGESCAVTACSAVSNGYEGFLAATGAVFLGCVAMNNQRSGFKGGIGGAMTTCASFGNGIHGFDAASGTAVNACAARDNGAIGVNVSSGSLVERCAVTTSQGTGVYSFGDSIVRHNQCSDNGQNPTSDGFGIRGAYSGNRFIRNNCTGNDRGVGNVNPGSYMVQNSCSGHAVANWSTSHGNVCLAVVAVTGGAILGDSGGVWIGSTDPHANYSY